MFFEGNRSTVRFIQWIIFKEVIFACFRLKNVFTFIRLSAKEPFSMDLFTQRVNVLNVNSYFLIKWSGIYPPTDLSFFKSLITFLKLFVEIG